MIGKNSHRRWYMSPAIEAPYAYNNVANALDIAVSAFAMTKNRGESIISVEIIILIRPFFSSLLIILFFPNIEAEVTDLCFSNYLAV